MKYQLIVGILAFVSFSLGFGRPAVGSDSGDAPPPYWAEIQKITASDAAAGDRLGVSADVDDTTVIVGASAVLDNDSPGAAYIFERDHGGQDQWGEVKKLTASDADLFDDFGSSVAISGDVAVVGAFGNDDAGPSTGSAYVFYRHQGGPNHWGEVKKIVASDADLLDAFGTVSIDGDTLVVGAKGESDPSFAPGAVYIFERNHGGPDNWGEARKIRSSDAQHAAQFGGHVRIVGDTLVVGAQHFDDRTGAAYIFERDHGGQDNWGEVKKLTASDGATEHAFGDLALAPDFVAVGAPGNGGGAVYIFARDHGGPDNWGELAKLTSSDGASGDGFGTNLAADGDSLLIGAICTDQDGHCSGSVYVFERDSQNPAHWNETRKITALDTTTGDVFGNSVAVCGNVAVVGATGNDDAGESSGSAYLVFSAFFGDGFESGDLSAWDQP